KRVQFLIEGVFAIRKAKFWGYPELDFVEREEQITHERYPFGMKGLILRMRHRLMFSNRILITPRMRNGMKT
ncbi:hypothetical protein LINPERPRIM_LOCUS12697, partial [Linum perenne]